jgi:hypothetical protein
MLSEYSVPAALIVVFSLCCSISTGEFPQNYKKDQIHFGQGGGFSWALNYFVLLEDGRLYQRSFRDSTFSLMDTWPDDFVTQMFANYKILQLDTLQHYEPGDLYYFIQYKSGQQPFHRIAWGKPGFRPDENTVTYYNLLYKSTKSKS